VRLYGSWCEGETDMPGVPKGRGALAGAPEEKGELGWETLSIPVIGTKPSML
jgi:hypothetical protein